MYCLRLPLQVIQLKMKRKKLHRSGSQASSMLIMKHRGKGRLGARNVPSEVTYIVFVLSAHHFNLFLPDPRFTIYDGEMKNLFADFLEQILPPSDPSLLIFSVWAGGGACRPPLPDAPLLILSLWSMRVPCPRSATTYLVNAVRLLVLFVVPRNWRNIFLKAQKLYLKSLYCWNPSLITDFTVFCEDD